MEAHAQSQTLYDQLGGRDAVAAAVEIFYKKIMKDKDLTPFFEGVDMARQMAKQRAFLTYAFGGTTVYSGQSLREAHKNAVSKGLNETHFGKVAGHLQATLSDLGVPANLQDEVMALVGTTKDDVLGR